MRKYNCMKVKRSNKFRPKTTIKDGWIFAGVGRSLPGSSGSASFQARNAAEMSAMIIVGIKIAGLRDHLKVKC